MDRLLLRVPEAAKLVGIGRSKAYDLVRTGEWPCVRIGKSVRVPHRWLVAWVDQQTAEAQAQVGDQIRLSADDSRHA